MMCAVCCCVIGLLIELVPLSQLTNLQVAQRSSPSSLGCCTHECSIECRAAGGSIQTNTWPALAHTHTAGVSHSTGSGRAGHLWLRWVDVGCPRCGRHLARLHAVVCC